MMTLSGCGAIFFYGHRPHVADAALVEIAGRGVVDHMRVSPNQ